jgi:hypothetical protein
LTNLTAANFFYTCSSLKCFVRLRCNLIGQSVNAYKIYNPSKAGRLDRLMQKSEKSFMLYIKFMLMWSIFDLMRTTEKTNVFLTNSLFLMPKSINYQFMYY